MKALKKQSKTKIILKNKIKTFLKERLWQYLLVIVFLISFAHLFNKEFEGLLFAISHIFIRKEFDKQFHSHRTSICLIITLSVIMLGIYTCLPMGISLLSSIPVAYGICWVGYIAQDRLDAKKELKKYSNDIYNMNENQLRQYCHLKGIFNERQDFVVYIVIEHLSFSEIANKIGYSIPTLKDWSKICKKKLNITEWK